MKFILIRVIMVFIFIVSAYIWGDWKNWKQYYPTMVFFGMGDLVYVTVFHERPLWRFPTVFLAPYLDELLLIFAIFFPTTLIFLSKYPKRLRSQIMYNGMWIGVYMLIEIFDLKTGIIKYYNGWNLWWSLLHNSVQFPLIALHNRKPLLAWIIVFVFLAIIMRTFHVPFVVNR